jgi:hypothetical protein
MWHIYCSKVIMKLFLTSALAAFTVIYPLTPAGAALPAGADDVVVNVNKNTIIKVNAADGTILWSASIANDGALAVDGGDLSIYTALGSHTVGVDGTIYKFDVNGAPLWTNTISLNSYCDFSFVTNAAVDATSGSPGVVWSENGCFGALAKSDRGTGAQQWSVLTYDIGRPSIDPFAGQIYAISNAGLNYDAETIYSVTAGGSLSYASSCEGYTDLNPADGMLYRGGGDPASRGCGTTLSQLNTSSLGATNWTMDLSSYINSLDSLAVQPWQGGYVYAGSIASAKIVVVDPTTQTVVTSFSTAVAPKFIAVNPLGGNLYIADDVHPFLIAYSPTGALVWINPNLGGTVFNVATVRGGVGVPPTPVPTIATSAATNVSANSATLNGTVNPNGASTTVYFEYGTTTNYGSQTPNQVFTGSTSQNVSANIAGLNSGTTYHYRIVGTNGGGTVSGSDVTFTTPAPTPTPTCPAPTVRISSDHSSINKGQQATITLSYGAGSAPPCNNVTVHFIVKTNAKNGVDFTLTDANGQDATVVGTMTSGPLTLRNLYTSRKKMLPVQIILQKNSAYYLGNTKVTIQLLP